MKTKGKPMILEWTRRQRKKEEEAHCYDTNIITFYSLNQTTDRERALQLTEEILQVEKEGTNRNRESL